MQRKDKVSIRCDTDPIARLISLKRSGPSRSAITISALHLSPIRAMTSRAGLHESMSGVAACFMGAPPWKGQSMIPKSGNRFSEKIMLKRKVTRRARRSSLRPSA
jgi:hypothetical protein